MAEDDWRVGSICVFGSEMLGVQDAFRVAFALRGASRTAFLPLSACRALAASAIFRMSWPDARERASRMA